MLATIEERLTAAMGRPEGRRLIAPRLVSKASAAWLEMLERRGRAASVLMPLIQRPSGLTLLMTERAAHLRDHAGQISFPGGRLSTAEETPVAAALREATEEIGLPPEDVRVLGQLDAHLTTTGFEITPVVGFVTAKFEPTPDPTEVASVFEMPLALLLSAEAIVEEERERLGTRILSYELHYQGHRIWGATAAILKTFRDVITGD
jgi:8-oxo-dGTP pyrophosphatase MutT (NUDIX family)